MKANYKSQKELQALNPAWEFQSRYDVSLRITVTWRTEDLHQHDL